MLINRIESWNSLRVTIAAILFIIGISRQLYCQTYSNVSQQAGINHAFYHVDTLFPSLMGGGVAVFDFDNDGWEDIYLTSGMERDQLYKNNGDGTFSEVGLAAGLGFTQNIVTMGVAVGDIDNDGFRDLFITTSKGFSCILLRNNGDDTFTNISISAGIADDSWSMSATFGDFNLDGFLDVYVANYVDSMVVTWDSLGNITGFDHTCYSNNLYVNNADLTFSESSLLLGVNDSGCALATAFTDYDNDGDMDIYVANDFGAWVVPNGLFQNNFTSNNFTEVGASAGMNAGIFGMGIAIGDYDEDLDLDYYVTNAGRNILYNNSGNGSFSDTTEFAGVENANTDSFLTTGWGAAFLDFDNDSYLDLFVVNGDVNMPPPFATAPKDPCKLFQNNGNATFTDVSVSAGISDSSRNRGLAYGDFDNDGDLDLVVTTLFDQNDSTAKTRLFLNGSPNNNHWLKVRLRGTSANRDGIGAHVTVFADGRSFLREIGGGSGYASFNSSIAHFGLGTITMVDSVIVVYPGGNTNSRANIGVDQTLLFIEDSIFTGVLGIEKAYGLKIYPNPARDLVNFEFEDYSGLEITLNIYDCRAQKIHTITTTDAPIIWRPRVSPGFYYCDLLIGSTNIRRKFIIQ